MFGVGKKSLLDPEEETFVIDIEEENEGYDGDRMKRAAAERRKPPLRRP